MTISDQQKLPSDIDLNKWINSINKINLDARNIKWDLDKAITINNYSWRTSSIIIAIAAGIFSGGFWMGIPVGLIAGGISHRVFTKVDSKNITYQAQGPSHLIASGSNYSLTFSFNEVSTGMGGYLYSFINPVYDGSVTEGILNLKVDDSTYFVAFNLNKENPISNDQLDFFLLWLSTKYHDEIIDQECCKDIFLALHSFSPDRKERAADEKSFITREQYTRIIGILKSNENFIHTPHIEYYKKIMNENGDKG